MLLVWHGWAVSFDSGVFYSFKGGKLEGILIFSENTLISTKMSTSNLWNLGHHIYQYFKVINVYITLTLRHVTTL